MSSTGRNEQRKAETRRKITRAANILFLDQGYDATSMEQISSSAGVAIRTIYLHFDSKAAILLEYFDAWVDAFVEGVASREAGEPVDAAVTRALAAMVDSGWEDDYLIDEKATLHPVVEFIGQGSPEIAGYIMQRWVGVLEVLAERFRVTAGLPVGSAEPHIEAAAVFAAWMTSVLDFRARFAAGTPGPSTHDVGELAIRSYVAGLDGNARKAPPA